MKKIKILIVFLFLTSAIAIAQQKKYVSYTVKKGETIKSIAREHHLSTRDLLRLNPDVGRKPKPNTVIIVPNKNYGKKEIVKAVDTLKYHVVQPKETLFGISKKYGITIEALKNANALLENGLKIGMKLVIPNAIPTQQKDSIAYVMHTVVKGDTLFNLTKRYDVHIADLLQLNPELKHGLKLGMVLKIKMKPVEIDEEIIEGAFAFQEKLDLEKEIKVVLMLPYKIDNFVEDSVRVKSFKKSKSLLNIVTDFHMGAQMAIDSLRKKGVQINVQFFDTENSKYKLQYILNSANFEDVDVVIGPLFFDKAHFVSTHLKAPVLAPIFSKKQPTLFAENLIKSSPNPDVYINKLLTYMKRTYNKENILIINDGKEESQHKLWKIVNKIKAFDSIQNITVIKPEEGFIDNEKIVESLKEDSDNWVLLVSDEVVTTSAAVNNLKTFIEGFNITLFSLNKGKNFDKIDNTFLGKLHFIFPTTDNLDTNNPDTAVFYKKFKENNYALPTKYAIRGFDVTYDAIVRIATLGNLYDGLLAGSSKRISSLFNYAQQLNGYIENVGVQLIQYSEDLTPVILE